MSYICTEIYTDQSVEFMFNDAQNSSRCIELFVEYSPVKSSEITPAVDYGVVDCGTGSSARVEHVSSDRDMSVADAVNVGVGINNDLDVADTLDDNTRIVRDNDEPLSPVTSEADASLSDDSLGDASDDEIVVCKPVVQGEQPLPKYVPKGMKFFRSLPSGPSEVPDEVGNEHNNMYWDERHPYQIGMGTKFDSKLHVKTAMTMWSLWHQRKFKVVESKLRRWHAYANFQRERQKMG